jgi:hypothetical protein
MKVRLYLFALVLFVFSMLYDLVVWGSVRLLPDIGPAIAESAHREAPLAMTYIAIGSVIDGWVPALGSFGVSVLETAWGDGLARMHEDPGVAMDLIFHNRWNVSHGWLKTMYWAAPVLLVLTLILWLRKPKAVRALRR